MIIDKFINSDRETKKTLIDYLHGLPKDLTSFIKININKPFADPSIYNSNIRKLSEYTNIGKYLDNRITIEKVPANNSEYQSEYSVISEKIDKIFGNNKERLLLKTLLDVESYDTTTIKKFESIIYGNHLSYNIREFIFNEIRPYKMQTYHIYQIFINDFESYDKEDQLINTYIDIMNTINKYDEILSYILYRYFRLINASLDEALKFIYNFPIAHDDPTMYKQLESQISSMYNSDLKITDTYKYSNNINREPSDIPDDIDKRDGYILNIKGFDSDTLDNIISAINKFKYKPNLEREFNNIDWGNELLNKYGKGSITFILSDNDYGNLRNYNDFYKGSIYGSNNDMYHIGVNDDIIYLLFKIANDNNSVYGVSTDGSNFLKFTNKKNTTYNVELPY